MSKASTTIRVSVDENVKSQAATALAAVGLTVPEAVRVFLTCVAADRGVPFAIKAAQLRSEPAGAGVRKPHEHFPGEPTVDDLCLLC
jgi:DNA-damage-inducible protein J